MFKQQNAFMLTTK